MRLDQNVTKILCKSVDFFSHPNTLFISGCLQTNLLVTKTRFSRPYSSLEVVKLQSSPKPCYKKSPAQESFLLLYDQSFFCLTIYYMVLDCSPWQTIYYKQPIIFTSQNRNPLYRQRNYQSQQKSKRNLDKGCL